MAIVDVPVLLYAGPKAACLLLSHGANPVEVLMNKDNEQDLSRILDWGVTVVRVELYEGINMAVERWEDMLRTEKGRKEVTQMVHRQEWKITMKYDKFTHSQTM